MEFSSGLRREGNEIIDSQAVIATVYLAVKLKRRECEQESVRK